MPRYITDAPRKKELFKRLRGDLIANDISNSDLSQLINRGTDYVSRCLNGKAQWNLDEQYIIMDAIHRPHKEVYLVFPPGGIDIEDEQPEAVAQVAFIHEAVKAELSTMVLKLERR